MSLATAGRDAARAVRNMTEQLSKVKGLRNPPRLTQAAENDLPREPLDTPGATTRADVGQT